MNRVIFGLVTGFFNFLNCNYQHFLSYFLQFQSHHLAMKMSLNVTLITASQMDGGNFWGSECTVNTLK